MAVDIAFDIFSHDLFSSIWNKYGLLNQFDLSRVFSNPNSLVASPFYDPIVKAVQCRQILFREVYKKKFTRDFSMYNTSASDFNDYLHKSFAESDFENLTIFELVYATCAFLSELYLYCCSSGDSDWSTFGQICHLCWALYFDAEKRDLFYSEGGMNMLGNTAGSYLRLHEFLATYWGEGLSSYDSISIEKIVNAMNEFNQFSLNDDFTGEETAAKDWVDFRIGKAGKSEPAITTENSYDFNTMEGLELILVDLKKLCDPSASQVIENEIFTSLCSDLKYLNMNKTEVGSLSVYQQTEDKNEQQSIPINATQVEKESFSNREVHTKTNQESTYMQIDHFERIRKSRSMLAKNDKGNLENDGKQKVLSSDAEVKVQLPNKNLHQSGSLKIVQNLSPTTNLEDRDPFVIEMQNGETQTITLDKKRPDVSPLRSKEDGQTKLDEEHPDISTCQSKGNRQTVLDEKRPDVSPLQSKENRLGISPLQSKGNLQTILGEKSPDVSPLQGKENRERRLDKNRPFISPLQSKGNRQIILGGKRPDVSPLQSNGNESTMPSEKLNVEGLNKKVSSTFSSVTTKKEEQPIVSPLQSKMKRLSLSNGQNNSPEGKFSSPLANQENKLRTQIVGNVYVSPVQDKENQQNLPNAKVLLKDENLSESNDTCIVQYQESNKVSKENNWKNLRTRETEANSAAVEADCDVTDDASQFEIPDKTDEKSKKKTKKRKKRKGAQVETNNPSTKTQISGTTPAEVKEKDSDDVKDLLRMLLVLGDKTGATYVRSTLRNPVQLSDQNKSDKKPILEEDLRKLFIDANPPPKW